MATVKFTLDPNNPPEMSPERMAALDAMTDEQITTAALADPDNPPLTDEELQRFRAARIAKQARAKQGMTQQQFASAYRISHGRLRDIEQGRGVRQDTALIAYLKVIEDAPDVVRKALENLPK